MTKSTGTNGIDIQRNYICVAQYSPADMVVRQVVVQPMADTGADGFWGAVTAELKDIGKRIRMTGQDAVCSLPCDMAVIRTLEAQSDESDQEGALCWELGTGLLGPIDDYIYDFYETDPGDQVERRRYLAAAVRKETLANLKKAFKSVKLNPYIVDIDLFALTNVFQTNYRERAAEPTVIVHGEFSCTKMIFVANSSYVDYAVFNCDAETVGASVYAGTLKDEVERLLTRNSAAAQGGAGVFLAGSLFAEDGFMQAAVAAVPQCEALNPFIKIVCDAGMDEAQQKLFAPRLAVAVGLALRGDEV